MGLVCNVFNNHYLKHQFVVLLKAPSAMFLNIIWGNFIISDWSMSLVRDRWKALFKTIFLITIALLQDASEFLTFHFYLWNHWQQEEAQVWHLESYNKNNNNKEIKIEMLVLWGNNTFNGKINENFFKWTLSDGEK